jgi:phosphatidylserine/phosphatidylglycerophosphate/cardiolipin synthase-like enzyme
VRICSPSFDVLDSILKPRGQRLLIAAPFMSAVGLNRIGSALDRHSWGGFGELEMWVFLSIDAHRAGVMDYAALQDFLQRAHRIRSGKNEIRIALFEHKNLHAKIYRSNHGALITSANLTGQAFETNVESCVLFTDPNELRRVESWISTTRKRMLPLSERKLTKFTTSLPPRPPFKRSKAIVLEEVIGRREEPPHYRFGLR